MKQALQNAISYFTSPKCPDFSKTTLRTMVVNMLQKRGSITNRDLVLITNGQTWLTSDLRRDGYIKPKAFDSWEVGASGKRYKRYQWSGKVEGTKK